MKALVVRQPWATLIALGVKTIETRPSAPNGPMRPDGERGYPGLCVEPGERIAIVAGVRKADVMETGWGPWRPLMDPARPGMLRDDVAPLPLGAIVCTAEVDDALPVIDRAEVGALDPGRSFLADTSAFTPGLGWLGGPRVVRTRQDGAAFVSVVDSARAERDWPLGDFTPGRWGWLLTDPQPCEPIPVKGRQGVFALPEITADALKAGAR